jgi:hypothetical protein
MKRIVVSFIMICLCFNMIAPSWSVGQDAVVLSARATMSSWAIVQFFSLFGSGVAAMDGALAENPLATGIRSGAQRDPRNSANDYLISISNALRPIVDGSRICSKVLPSMVALHDLNQEITCNCIRQRYWPPGGGLSILMLLLFLVILSQSNLPGEAFVVLKHGECPARFHEPGFLLVGI